MQNIMVMVLLLRSILLHHLLSSLVLTRSNTLRTTPTVAAFSPNTNPRKLSLFPPAVTFKTISSESSKSSLMPSSSSITTTTTTSICYSWRPGTDLLRVDPSTLSKEVVEDNDGIVASSSQHRSQLAKDEDYASAVLKSWRDELDARTTTTTTGNDEGDDDGGLGSSVASPYLYKCKMDGTPLHGYIYRPSPPPPPSSSSSSTNDSSSSTNNDNEKLLPGIILFHTGAGPQDIFLRWKADSLVANAHEVFGNNNNNNKYGEGCIVLIADILGDSTGWAWHNREKYNTVRTSILVPDEDGERKRLQGRVRAALDAIQSQPGVDRERIGAMGYCLGGHPILELARMKNPCVKAMVTFHGVFDGVRGLSSVERSSGSGSGGNSGGSSDSSSTEGKDDAIVSSTDSTTTTKSCNNVLVCTGEDDPFIPTEDLDAAMEMFDDLGYRSEMIKFENTRHGFTNPAQDYNPSEAFAYSADACAKAWSAALSVLKRNVVS